MLKGFLPRAFDMSGTRRSSLNRVVSGYFSNSGLRVQSPLSCGRCAVGIPKFPVFVPLPWHRVQSGAAYFFGR